MAKLETRVTTLELLDAIRDGATKTELIKKYRTSESELASTLHPLFRNGKMTAEEFNNFFKGVPVKRSEPASAAGLAETDTALSEEPPSSGIEIPMEPTDGDTPYAADEVEPGAAPTVEEAGSITEILPAFSSPTGEIPRGEIIPDEPSEVKAAPPTDSAGMSALLDIIFSKLTVIDNRLAEIERKLQG